MSAERTQIKPSQIRSTAKLLQREGRKILRKHEARVGEQASQEIRASLAAIDHLRGAEDWAGLGEETERLDELLQSHASFARKSMIRELIENVGFAVAVAGLLRCCTYEPFNIPSISMMPTLRIGDYIFVNKYIHGIQVPLTSYILGENVGKEIERGEVIVFRFPLDKSVDYIKRVIGIPGDVIRVQGQKMWIQRGGEGDFELIPRRALETPCVNSDHPGQPLTGCTVYEETLDNRRYLIRMAHDVHDMMHQGSIRTIRVPQGKYFVRGDNRQQSQDSLLWEVKADIAQAHKLVRKEDIRDILNAPGLELRSRVDPDLAVDPHHARVEVSAPKGGPAMMHELSIWRDAPTSTAALYTAMRQTPGQNWEATRMEKLLAGSELSEAQRRALLAQGRKWDAVAVLEEKERFHALMHWDSEKLVVRYSCGKSLCRDRAQVALALAKIVDRAQRQKEARAEDLLVDPQLDLKVNFLRRRGIDPQTLRNRYFRGYYEKTGQGEVLFETEAFTRGHEGLRILEEARFLDREIDPSAAQNLSLGGGNLRWAKSKNGDFFGFWRAPKRGNREFAISLHCMKALCSSQSSFLERLKGIEPDLVAISQGKLRPAALLRSQQDLQLSSKRAAPQRYPWDQVQSVASMNGPRQQLSVELDWDGPTPREQLLTKWRGPAGAGKDIESELGASAFLVDERNAFRVAWVQRNTNSALQLSCGKDLCTTPDQAIAMANRISERAGNSENFVARDVAIPQPFVPRGNIKGRSDLIWWPLGRFGGGMDAD